MDNIERMLEIHTDDYFERIQIPYTVFEWRLVALLPPNVIGPYRASARASSRVQISVEPLQFQYQNHFSMGKNAIESMCKGAAIATQLPTAINIQNNGMVRWSCWSN